MNEKGFFAYSSTPASCGEAIEDAIKLINQSGHVELFSWRKLSVSGKLIISEIVDAIDNADFFCADLTGLNDNVLFELGYALAKRKQVFLINDISHIESARRYKEFGLLQTLGYCRYSKSQDIVKAFFEEHPYDPLSKPYWDTLVETIDANESRTPLLILNGQIDTNFNQDIVNLSKFYKLPAIIDDPSENKVQPLTWYVQQLHHVPALLTQLSTTARSGHEIHNAKCSLISGMALGLGRRLKMVAEKPYDCPLDFRELLEKFSNRAECESIVSEYFKAVQKDIGELLSTRNKNVELKVKRSELQKVNFGEAIAEHESDNLTNYFVVTANVNTLIKNEYNIVVGRKGSGKTATLYYLDRELRNDKRNHVVLITPITFEVEGLVSLMEATKDNFEVGFLLECIWKFLIYSEIAKYFYEQISAKPLFAVTLQEKEFKEYVEKKSNLFLLDFSTRLEEQIKILRENKITDIEAGQNQIFRLKVSEYLHQNILGELKEHFAQIISKKQSLIVLIDNLDKSWKPNAKIHVLSKYILGLLGVAGRIVKDLSYVKSIRTEISFHLTLFLRSDIYRYVMLNAREPDKIEVTKLVWADKDLLFRIIEERFVELSLNSYLPEDFWNLFIVDNVNGKDIKDYIMDIIFPRPRDIIYFLKSAKDTAVSRGHNRIEKNDLESAYKDYSAWVFKSIIVENGITLKQMEDFMYELMASRAIISEAEIEKKMAIAKIDPANGKLEKFIDHLVDLTIIGRETKSNEFSYEYDIDSSKKLKVLADKLGTKRYRIHNALVSYLECIE